MCMQALLYAYLYLSIYTHRCACRPYSSCLVSCHNTFPIGIATLHPALSRVQIYGAPHLLRLLVRLPSVAEHASFSAAECDAFAVVIGSLIK